MTPCNIIIIIRHEGTPLHHITNHETQLKIHNTYSFICTIHTTIRYLADFSCLKPIHMYKRVKGHLKFWIKFWICIKFWIFNIHTHPPKVFIHSNPKMGEWKKGIILTKMTRTNLKPIAIV